MTRLDSSKHTGQGVQSPEACTCLSWSRASEGLGGREVGGRREESPGPTLEGLMGWRQEFGRYSGPWGKPVEGGNQTDCLLNKNTGFTVCGRSPLFALRMARPPFRPSWETSRPLISWLPLLSEFVQAHSFGRRHASPRLVSSLGWKPLEPLQRR